MLFLDETVINNNGNFEVVEGNRYSRIPLSETTSSFRSPTEKSAEKESVAPDLASAHNDNTYYLRIDANRSAATAALLEDGSDNES